MARPIRHMPAPYTIFVVTVRTLQERFLLRPSKEANEIILACLGRSQFLYPNVRLHHFDFLSNHFDLILSAPDFHQISAFVGHFESVLARKLGCLVEWRQKFWGRRFRPIPVLDDEALLGRVRYALEHGCKENLVMRPRDWPGVSCVAALTEGEALVGYWHDRTEEYKDAQRGKTVKSSDYVRRYEIKLTPLPLWADLSEPQRQAQYRHIIKDIEEETRERHEKNGTRPLGAEAVLAQDPHDRPQHSKHSPAPLCHAASEAVRKTYRQAYRAFVNAYYRASELFRAGQLDVEFPEHCFRPPLPYRAGASPGACAAAPG